MDRRISRLDGRRTARSSGRFCVGLFFSTVRSLRAMAMRTRRAKVAAIPTPVPTATVAVTPTQALTEATLRRSVRRNSATRFVSLCWCWLLTLSVPTAR